MSTEQRMERAILIALIERLGAAGYQPAAVWTEEDYVMSHGGEVLAVDGAPEFEHAMTTEEVLQIFSDYDLYAPTIHFTAQNTTDWGRHGVMVVPGNGEDFISDWHCQDTAFDKIVSAASDAAHDGAITLNVTEKT